jgi:hypothetical protein
MIQQITKNKVERKSEQLRTFNEKTKQRAKIALRETKKISEGESCCNSTVACSTVGTLRTDATYRKTEFEEAYEKVVVLLYRYDCFSSDKTLCTFRHRIITNSSGYGCRNYH